jgi:hypothetical protein
VLTFRVGGAERALRRYHWSGGPAISEAVP